MDHLLDRQLDQNDPRGYFTCVYRAVTVRILEGIAAGEFVDATRMERFDVLFAGYFLDACRDHAAGRPVSASWQVALDAPSRWRVALQHLLAGMNAHINLDLGVAAARTQGDAPVEELRDDFERLNDILAAMVDRMQTALGAVSPWSSIVDRLAGSRDEWLACWSIERARQGAWELAERLTASPAEQGRIIELRDRKVAFIGSRILTPSLPVRTVAAVASLREHNDLRRVVDALG
jgi:hypothetical protein